jgi:RHS repeat-associated protein
MKKIITFFTFYIVFFNCVKAQEPRENFELDGQITGNKEYIARDYINLKDGFSYTAGGDNSFLAKINPLLVFPSMDNLYLSDNGTITNNPSSGGVVGKLPGSINVSSSGAATYSIPVKCPPGTAGSVPGVSINYNSQLDFGLLGKGWSINATSSITRTGKNMFIDGEFGGVRFDGNDRFVLDGQRLIRYSGTYGGSGSEYRTEFSGFSKIKSYGTSGSGPSYFIVETKDGRTLEYGKTADSRIEKQQGASVLRWFLNKETDPFGNYIKYNYYENKASGESRISSIEYTGNTNMAPYNKLEFSYTSIDDPKIRYVGGTKLTQSVVLDKIIVRSQGAIVWNYDFDYDFTNGVRLTKVTQDDGKGTYLSPTIFKWGENRLYGYNRFDRDRGSSPQNPASNVRVLTTGDFNGDGKRDRIDYNKSTSKWELLLYSGRQYLFDKVDEGDFSSSSSLITTDFNKDGKDDILEVFPLGSGKDYRNIKIWISNGTGFVSKSLFNCSSLFGTSKNANEFSVGDFDGNGIVDVMFINTDDEQNTKWKIFSYDESSTTGLKELFSGSGGIIKESSYCSDPESGQTQVCNPLYSSSNSVFLDFNGDGKTDVLYFGRDDLSHVMTFNGSNFVELFSTDVLDIASKLGFRDVNNDGLVDVTTYSDNFLNTGNGFARTSNNFVYDKSGDFNGDGYADRVGIDYDLAEKKYKFNVKFFQDGGYSDPISLFSVYSSSVRVLGIINHFDYDGDGIDDFLFHLDGKVYVGYVKNCNKNLRVSSITNGLKSKTNITYSSLAFSPNVYTKGNSCTFPLIDVIDSRYVVSAISSSNGVGGYNSTGYKYFGLKHHLQGRGSMGFETIEVYDRTSNVKRTSSFEINSEYLFPYLKRTETRFNNGTLISSTDFTPGVKKVNGNSIFPYTSKIVNNNNVHNITETSNFWYDNYGNQTRTLINHNGEGYTNVANVFVPADTWIPSKVSSTRTTKEAVGDVPKSSLVTFKYNSTNGSLTSQTVSQGKTITTSYQYNGLGLPTKMTVKGSDVADARVEEYEYDPKGRFRIKTTNALGQSSHATFDGASGNVLTSTDMNDLVTRYEYDSFGRRQKTITPDGAMSVTTLHWAGSTPTHAAYYSYTQTSSSPPSKVFYDEFGRKLQTESKGFDGRSIFTETRYNNKGQIVFQSSPHYASASDMISQSFIYDEYGRVTSVAGPTESRRISYGKKSYTVESVTETKKYTMNGLGQLVSVEDRGGQITYDYNSLGKPVTVVSNGNHVTTMEYDAAGNQKSLNEPNLGSVEYSYNAFGELLSQDRNGKVTSLTYDKLGRMTTKSEEEGTTTYVYDTRRNGLLSSIKLSNGDGEEYFYGEFGRISSKREIIDGKNYTESIEYNQYGQIKSLTYPSGFKIKYNYNDQFYLSEILRSDNNHSIWKADKISALGQPMEFTHGNDLTTVKTYRYGYLTGITTGNIQDWSYDWNFLTGNLRSRSDNNNGLMESFSYDDLNRLTRVQINGGATQTFAYEPNGNIESSSVAGEYKYDPVKLNAVVEVDSPQSAISQEEQMVEYTSFNKIKEVTEGENSATLSYGINHQRVKMELDQDGSTLNRIYAHGNYEEETGSTNRKIHYITTGDGVSAMYISNSGNNGSMYYIHKDHLGSVNVITDENGAVLEEHSFDAWGRRRNHSNWGYENINTDGLTDRGFTGHEHLDQFGMINMNGRVYDPVIGRFLSPDKYVQAPQFTQSFNRYSYCFNNPLNHTDPSGWYGENTSGGAGEYRYGDPVGADGYTTSEWLFYSSPSRHNPAAQRAFNSAQNGKAIFYYMSLQMQGRILRGQYGREYVLTSGDIAASFSGKAFKTGGNDANGWSGWMFGELYFGRHDSKGIRIVYDWNSSGGGTWDPTTNDKIAQLHSTVQWVANSFINQVESELGIKLRVAQGVRTFSEQNGLYAKGRTTSGSIVTNAKGGQSYHNYGLAIDVVEISSGKAIWDTNWSAISEIGIHYGFEWGGNFNSISDKPHFQMTFGYSTSDLLKIYNSGQW